MNEHKNFANSTLEAIYWWNRDEHYYHKYFFILDNIYKDKELLDFFTTKVFDTFLKDYSVRRNIASGRKMIDSFIDELIKNEFVHRVKKGDIKVVDNISEIIKQSGDFTNGNETRSLLSKIAFLINPSVFSLLDNLVKESLWTIIKNDNVCYKYELEYYTKFIEQTNIQIETNSKILKKQTDILKTFKGTNAYDYFLKNPKAFERRVYDKYLWLMQQNENSKIINNNAYKVFFKL